MELANAPVEIILLIIRHLGDPWHAIRLLTSCKRFYEIWTSKKLSVIEESLGSHWNLQFFDEFQGELRLFTQAKKYCRMLNRIECQTPIVLECGKSNLWRPVGPGIPRNFSRSIAVTADSDTTEMTPFDHNTTRGEPLVRYAYFDQGSGALNLGAWHSWSTGESSSININQYKRHRVTRWLYLDLDGNPRTFEDDPPSNPGKLIGVYGKMEHLNPDRVAVYRVSNGKKPDDHWIVSCESIDSAIFGEWKLPSPNLGFAIFDDFVVVLYADSVVAYHVQNGRPAGPRVPCRNVKNITATGTHLYAQTYKNDIYCSLVTSLLYGERPEWHLIAIGACKTEWVPSARRFYTRFITYVCGSQLLLLDYVHQTARVYEQEFSSRTFEPVPGDKAGLRWAVGIEGQVLCFPRGYLRGLIQSAMRHVP